MEIFLFYYIIKNFLVQSDEYKKKSYYLMNNII